MAPAPYPLDHFAVPLFKVSNKVNVSSYGSLNENCLSQVQVLEVGVQLVLFEEAVEPLGGVASVE